MQGGGLSPGDGWNVALLFVEVALGAGVALVVLALAGALAVITVRAALHADLKGSAKADDTSGQVPAVGAVEPRLTPADHVPVPLPPSLVPGFGDPVVDADAVRRMPGR